MGNKNDIVGYVTETPIHKQLLSKCKDILSEYYKKPFTLLTSEQIFTARDKLLVPVALGNPRYKLNSMITIRDKYLRWIMNDTEQRYTKVDKCKKN